MPLTPEQVVAFQAVADQFHFDFDVEFAPPVPTAEKEHFTPAV